MRENDIARALAEPSPELIEAVWENLPSPFEIGEENEAAARRLLAAILAVVSDRAP